MLKNWFGNLLFKLCGDLLEDFPKNDIEIKKWQGVGEKRNLKLKHPKIKSVFEYLFGICVEVKEAQIALLRFQIPWNKIWKEPSRILIKDAYICVGARSEFSEEFMRGRMQRKKMSLIQKAIKKFSNCFAQESTGLMKSLKNFLSEMIVIEIENLHLKFEDEGICLKSQKFSLETTLSLYLTPSMQNVQQSKLRKKQLDFEIRNSGVYLRMENQKQIHDQNESQIVEPINLKIVISTQLLQESNEHALRQIDIVFADPVQINMDNNQFHALMRLLRLKQWHCQIGNHLVYRPNFNQRPKNHQQKWIKYLQQINQSYFNDRQRYRDGFKQLEQKKQQREEYINVLLIDMFHQQNTMVKIKNELRKYNQEEFQELKNKMEDILLVEEIIFANKKVNDIINCQELLKQKLQQLNLEQNNGENKKYTFWSPWQIFWKKNQQDIEGTEFNEQYEKLKMSEDSQQILKLFDIKIKNIQFNFKSVLGGISNTFLRIQFEDIRSIIKNRSNSFNLQYSIKNIEAYDTMNPNKDYQCVFSHHAFANRSQKEQFYNKDRQLLSISYELQNLKKHSEKCHNFVINIIPLLISLNDTVIIRLYPFLTQIRKHDYFFDLVTLKKILAYEDFLQHFIHRVCEKKNIIINIHTDAITLRVPESAIKQNCPMLQFNLQSYNLSIEKEINQQIDNFSVSFQYNHNGEKTIFNLLDQCTLISTLNKNIQDNQVDIKIKNTLSELFMRIPILPTDFLKNFIYNMLGTMENLKSIQMCDELDIQTHSQVQNKRKRSHSLSLQRDQSSISRRDDTSSQNGSEIFYDADEFLMLQQMQSLQYTMHMSPLERREELLKKWMKLKTNLSYIITGLFKDVDPYFRNFIKKLKIEILSECPKLIIQIAKQKCRQNQRSTELKLLNLRSSLSKLHTQQEFEFELKLNDVHASIYKLRDICKIIDLKHQKSHDVLTDINSDMLNLLPFLLRLKELTINYKIKIGLIKVQFQDKQSADIVYILIELKQLLIRSEEPFRLFYRKTLEDQPFFLEINNSQVAQWNTSFRCTFQLLVNYYNKIFNQIAQPLIEKSGYEIQFIKNLSEIQTIIQSKELLIHITPHLIQTLYYLNRHSIKIKSLLLKEQNEGKPQIIVKNTQFSNQFIMENEDASLYVSQLELQHSTHYKAKYQIQIKETIKNQLSYKQFEYFYKKQIFNERISETSKENMSERESIKQIEEQQQQIIKIKPIYYIFVNLTGQKLLFNINGIESKVSHQEFKYICCKEQIKFKFTPHVHYFNYSCIIQDYMPGVFFLRISSFSEKDRQICYLLQITQHNQTKIYQLEQLPKAPYLIKNKCSQLISISQDKYPNIVVDSGFSETFCWDMPFENPILQLTMQSDGLTKQFLIDVDGFNNQEILIDKNLYDTIDKEYSLEIFNDGVQKVVVITEREALKPKLKTFKIKFDVIGISIIDQIELVFLSCNNFLFMKQVKNDKTIYILELEDAQIDNQSYFLPKRQLFVQTAQQSTMKKILTNCSKLRQTSDSQQNVINSQQVPSGVQNSQDTRYNIIDKDTYYQGAAFQHYHQHTDLQGEQGLFRIKCKQKTITEILVHLMYIRIRLPNYKVIIDGQLMHKLIEFAVNTRSLLPDNSKFGSTNKSFDRVNTSQNESFSKQVQPKLIHIDKIQVQSFTFRLKFKNLMLIEQVLQTFHHLAGLAAFFLTQLKQLHFEFPAYVKSEQSQIMEGNYEAQISNMINFYGAHLSQLIHSQINASNILKNQGNLSKQINTELNKFLAEMNAENQDFSGWSFKFQLLQTGFNLCQSMFSAIDSTLETVLQGIQKYLEAQNAQSQVQQKTSFYNKLSQLFHKVSSMHKNFLPNSYNIQSFQQIIQNLKTRRLPLFITDRISNYSEDLGKIQLFKMWKQADLGNKFIYYQLNEQIYLYLSKLIFALIDVNQNMICLEIQTQLFQSIGNNNNQCWIKYKWKSDEEEIGMKQFKIKKYTLNFIIADELVTTITNQVKKQLETLNQTQSQIFSLMME